MLTYIVLVLLVSFSPVTQGSIPSRYVDRGTVTKDFIIPKGLERAVDFWIDVYSRYDVDEFIVHDSENHVVYEVINISDIERLPYFTQKIKDEIIESRVLRVQKKYRDALKVLHGKSMDSQEMDPFLSELKNKFSSIEGKNKFLDSSMPGRMRIQKGQRSHFRKGLYYSGQYLPEMEKIFKSYGLPVELARLPFVESYFNPHATSHKQASGIWQFMRGTGKEYLKVREDYDERKDPILSTHAAAKLLRQSYVYLDKDWPLAVTAYNHGRFGMKRAVKIAGTRDLVKLIKEYKGRNFGFASKNFYAEFLAALYLEQNHKDFFKDADFASSGNYGIIMVLKPMRVSEMVLLLDIDREDIKAHNPAISRRVINSDGVIKKGAKIRVPIARFRQTISRAESIDGLEDYIRFI